MNLVSVYLFTIAAIFTSVHGRRGAPLPPPEELLSTSTGPLENLSLTPGDFIILVDSTPVPKMTNVHIMYSYHKSYNPPKN